jgi:broad specificity phosphatase PhoE
MHGRRVRLLLIRHGQSEWNESRRWQGLADSPLTQLGRNQAKQAAKVLDARVRNRGWTFAAAWSSDLQRAVETTSIISDKLGLASSTIDKRLRESDAGEWEGLTPDQIEKRWPGWLKANRRPKTFESFENVASRSIDVVRSIAAEMSELAPNRDAVGLLVTHSGVLRTLVRAFGEPDGRIPNLGGLWMSVNEKSATSDHLNVDGNIAGISIDGRFHSDRIVTSSIDAPGEDPGYQADEAERERGTNG